MNKRIIGIAKSIEKIRNTMPKCPNPESFDVLKKHSPLTTRQKNTSYVTTNSAVSYYMSPISNK